MDYKNILTQTHTLIAGTTGAGKSTLLNGVINYAIKNYAPSVLRFAFIDLKRVELSAWRDTAHCYAYAADASGAINLLRDVARIISERYKKMEAEGKRQSNLTHLFIVIDELADLIAHDAKLFTALISKIGRLGRAANVHLLICTQAPNRAVLNATIQQNITCAIALRCKTAIESRQVLGIAGAEKLARYGECIVWDANGFRWDTFGKISEQEIQQTARDNYKR